MSAARPGPSSEPPRVAYAVGRRVGNAVTRNRVRRRLRASMTEHHELLRPGWGYLVGATPSAAGATYRDLDSALSTALRQHLNGASD